MNFEKFRQAGIEEAYKEADPTAFSPVPSSEPLTETGASTPDKRYAIYTDGADQYVQLRDSGARQQVVARLLKGVLNVADVVSRPGEHGTEYYSKMLPHDRIERPSSRTEILADLEVISLVFNDQDRRYHTADDYRIPFEHNLKVEGGRVSHFDFAEAELNVDARLTRSRKDDTPALLEQTRVKLEALKQLYAGEEGKRHFLAIIGVSGKHPAQLFPYSGASETPESLYEGFVSRIDRALAHVEGALEEERQQVA